MAAHPWFAFGVRGDLSVGCNQPPDAEPHSCRVNERPKRRGGMLGALNEASGSEIRWGWVPVGSVFTVARTHEADLETAHPSNAVGVWGYLFPNVGVCPPDAEPQAGIKRQLVHFHYHGAAPCTCLAVSGGTHTTLLRSNAPFPAQRSLGGGPSPIHTTSPGIGSRTVRGVTSNGGSRPR